VTGHLSLIELPPFNLDLMTAPTWVGLLYEAISRNPNAKGTTYACATIDNDVPRVRYVVHRSLLSATSARPLLVASTDVRTPKVSQLHSSSSVAEIAWWFEESAEQYRITANAYVLPKPGHVLHGRFPFDKLSTYPDYAAEGDVDDRERDRDRVRWWERERIDTFDNKMGDVLRASFCRPVPGSPLPGGYESAKQWPERLPRSSDAENGTEEAEQVTEALNNFALVVFEPVKVERIELGIVPNRRTSWKWKDDKSWEMSILVP